MTLDRRKAIVNETRAYYDGAADAIYRDIWGENLHLGMFAHPDEDLPTAMDRSNDVVARSAGLGPDDRVLDVGCGYGAAARYLARTYGCRVLATNISERELERAADLTREAGLEDRVAFEWADFHELPYDAAGFDVYWSQEAFLHAADKGSVLAEAHRVLKPGGRLVFTDLLVRDGTPEADRERICDRIKSPDMWDAPRYRAALEAAGFGVALEADYSEHVAPTYAWIRARLEERRAEFEARIGKDMVDRTSAALAFWVDAAKAGRIGWVHFVARR